MTTNSLTLLAVGDVGPIHEPVDAYGALASSALAAADLRFGQVERVYSERGAFQVHSGGEHSRVKPHMAAIFDHLKFDVVSVASNHAMDWGPDALLDSIELLRKKGIATVGAGRNLKEAREPAFIEKNGVRVAFLGILLGAARRLFGASRKAGRRTLAGPHVLRACGISGRRAAAHDHGAL